MLGADDTKLTEVSSLGIGPFTGSIPKSFLLCRGLPRVKSSTLKSSFTSDCLKDLERWRILFCLVMETPGKNSSSDLDVNL